MTTQAMKETEAAPANELAIYNAFRQQLAVIKDHNAKIVFDYSDPNGNKEARSHVYKLRQTKAAIEKARKAEKAASLEYGRKVDTEAAKLTEDIEEMIEVHQKPLDEFEQKEKERVDGIMARIAGMTITAEYVIGKTSAELKSRLDEITSIDVEEDESWGEFGEQAIAARYIAVEYLNGAIGIAEKREQEAAELERLRAEAEQRRIADEKRASEEAAAAEEKTRKEAEKKAEEDRKAAEEKRAKEEKERTETAAAEAAEKARKLAEQEAADREKSLKEATEKAQREAKETEERRVREGKEAEQRQTVAVQAEKDRQKQESDAKAAEDARREADKEHRRKIHQEIIAGIAKLSIGISEEQARNIVIGICGDAIPHVKIIY